MNRCLTAVFRFDGIVGRRVFFDSPNRTDRAKWNIRLTAPNGEQVLDVDADFDARLYSLLDAGTYILELRGGLGDTGDYRYRPLITASCESLSAREGEVAELLARGRTYKECAVELNLSLHTVRTYIRRIYKKLHVNCRHEAMERLNRIRPGSR